MKNKILDYMQVLSRLKEIEEKSNKIKFQKPIGKTTYGLPILHYTVGTGKNHIVLGAAQHGSEIITTNFLIEVMDRILKNDKRFEFLSNGESTVHFLPILNPEGYLISTSAIRKMITEEMPEKEAAHICNEYVEAYSKDDRVYAEARAKEDKVHVEFSIKEDKTYDGTNTRDSEGRTLKINTKIKEHQRFFGHISPYMILGQKFKHIQKSLIKIYDENGVPEGTLANWSSNGNGVDLNQNAPYNNKIQAIEEGKQLYAHARYDNIETTKTGPIGCPMKGKAFEYEPENKALLEFLLGLKHTKDIELCAFLNYHSTGGIIFYKPYGKSKEIPSNEIMKNMKIEEVYNKKIAEAYSAKTKYRLIETESSINCFNDLVRLQIPGDILIELSTIVGNPLAPFIPENYNKIIEDNINAVSYTLQKIPEMNRIKNEFIKSKEKDLEDNNKKQNLRCINTFVR